MDLEGLTSRMLAIQLIYCRGPGVAGGRQGGRGRDIPGPSPDSPGITGRHTRISLCHGGSLINRERQ